MVRPSDSRFLLYSLGLLASLVLLALVFQPTASPPVGNGWLQDIGSALSDAWDYVANVFKEIGDVLDAVWLSVRDTFWNLILPMLVNLGLMVLSIIFTGGTVSIQFQPGFKGMSIGVGTPGVAMGFGVSVGMNFNFEDGSYGYDMHVGYNFAGVASVGIGTGLNCSKSGDCNPTPITVDAAVKVGKLQVGLTWNRETGVTGTAGLNLDKTTKSRTTYGTQIGVGYNQKTGFQPVSVKLTYSTTVGSSGGNPIKIDAGGGLTVNPFCKKNKQACGTTVMPFTLSASQTRKLKNGDTVDFKVEWAYDPNKPGFVAALIPKVGVNYQAKNGIQVTARLELQCESQRGVNKCGLGASGIDVKYTPKFDWNCKKFNTKVTPKECLEYRGDTSMSVGCLPECLREKCPTASDPEQCQRSCNGGKCYKVTKFGATLYFENRPLPFILKNTGHAFKLDSEALTQAALDILAKKFQDFVENQLENVMKNCDWCSNSLKEMGTLACNEQQEEAPWMAPCNSTVINQRVKLAKNTIVKQTGAIANTLFRAAYNGLVEGAEKAQKCEGEGGFKECGGGEPQEPNPVIPTGIDIQTSIQEVANTVDPNVAAKYVTGFQKIVEQDAVQDQLADSGRLRDIYVCIRQKQEQGSLDFGQCYTGADSTSFLTRYDYAEIISGNFLDAKKSFDEKVLLNNEEPMNDISKKVAVLQKIIVSMDETYRGMDDPVIKKYFKDFVRQSLVVPCMDLNSWQSYPQITTYGVHTFRAGLFSQHFTSCFVNGGSGCEDVLPAGGSLSDRQRAFLKAQFWKCIPTEMGGCAEWKAATNVGDCESGCNQGCLQYKVSGVCTSDGCEKTCLRPTITANSQQTATLKTTCIAECRAYNKQGSHFCSLFNPYYYPETQVCDDNCDPAIFGDQCKNCRTEASYYNAQEKNTLTLDFENDMESWLDLYQPFFVGFYRNQTIPPAGINTDYTWIQGADGPSRDKAKLVNAVRYHVYQTPLS